MYSSAVMVRKKFSCFGGAAFDGEILCPFFREGGSLSYGGLSSGTMVALCAAMLENSGNAYDLHKWVMDKGMICPVLFKSYAVYTTRGAARNLSPAVDWVIHGQEVTQ